MYYVLIAEWHDIEESQFEPIAAFISREAAEDGKNEIERIRAQIKPYDRVGFNWWYEQFDQGRYLDTSDNYPDFYNTRNASRKDALKQWPKIKAIIGNIPYRLFTYIWDYEIYEVRSGLSFPSGMERNSAARTARWSDGE